MMGRNMQPLFEKHFADFSLKKAELAELHRLGISQETYESYLDTRKTKPTIADCCGPLRNIAWLRQQTEQEGGLRELGALLLKHQEARNTITALTGLHRLFSLGAACDWR